MRPFASISGLPELPPTMSLSVDRLNGVSRSSVVRACCHDAGSANGARPVARSKSRPSVVNGATGEPFSSQPRTVPTFSRNVNVASGYDSPPIVLNVAFAILA